jgi:hypothetical protein
MYPLLCPISKTPSSICCLQAVNTRTSARHIPTTIFHCLYSRSPAKCPRCVVSLTVIRLATYCAMHVTSSMLVCYCLPPTASPRHSPACRDARAPYVMLTLGQQPASVAVLHALGAMPIPTCMAWCMCCAWQDACGYKLSVLRETCAHSCHSSIPVHKLALHVMIHVPLRVARARGMPSPSLLACTV